MAQEPNNPHDALVKALLEDPERAGALIRENAPEPLARKLANADPEHLPGSFIDAALKETHSDRLFRAPLVDGRDAFVYVLIEHKSAPDPETPLQIDGYRNRIWRRYVHQGQGSAGGAERARNLPPIFPLVLYHGAQEWRVPLSVMECINADDELLALQRDGGYWVRHVRPDETDEQLASRADLRAGLRALALAHLGNLTWADVAQIMRHLPEGHPLEIALLVYIARVFATTEADVQRALVATRPERAEELAMTVAEEWIERGEKNAEARTLLRQIERKFGTEAKDAYHQRVANASGEELELWLDRIVDAESVASLFSDE